MGSTRHFRSEHVEAKIRAAWLKGWSSTEIACVYRLDVQVVRSAFRSFGPPPPPAEAVPLPADSARKPGQGMTGRLQWVRRLHYRGLTVPEIAARLRIPASEVERTLAGRRAASSRGPDIGRAFPAEELARRAAEREAGRAEEMRRVREERAAAAAAAKAARLAARLWAPAGVSADDPRLRDAGPGARPGATAVPSPAAVEAPGLPASPAEAMADLVSLESWGGPSCPHVEAAHRPRKLTPDALNTAAELRRQGMSWPAIAEHLGVHRQSLYFARRAGRLTVK